MHHPRVPVHKSVTQSAQSDRPPTELAETALEARARAAEAELLAIEEEPKATSKAKNKRPSYWAQWSLVFFVLARFVLAPRTKMRMSPLGPLLRGTNKRHNGALKRIV